MMEEGEEEGERGHFSLTSIIQQEKKSIKKRSKRQRKKNETQVYTHVTLM